MKLTDEDYKVLKEDQSISSSVDMLKDVMKDSPQQRSEKMKKRKAYDKQDIDQAIADLDKVVSNYLLSERLKSIIPALNTELAKLKKEREAYLQIRRKKVGSQIERNLWIESILVRLLEFGEDKQSRRVDFIYRLFIEYDLDGCRTAIESDKTPDDILDKFDEANMKRSFRLIDKKATDDYINN